MFKVMLTNGQWIYNIPASEALVYLEEGYHIIRM